VLVVVINALAHRLTNRSTQGAPNGRAIRRASEPEGLSPTHMPDFHYARPNPEHAAD
jgi:hypothetical protein